MVCHLTRHAIATENERLETQSYAFPSLSRSPRSQLIYIHLYNRLSTLHNRHVSCISGASPGHGSTRFPRLPAAADRALAHAERGMIINHRDSFDQSLEWRGAEMRSSSHRADGARESEMLDGGVVSGPGMIRIVFGWRENVFFRRVFVLCYFWEETHRTEMRRKCCATTRCADRRRRGAANGVNPNEAARKLETRAQHTPTPIGAGMSRSVGPK